jgi:hypothetical protein
VAIIDRKVMPSAPKPNRSYQDEAFSAVASLATSTPALSSAVQGTTGEALP